MNLIRPDIKVYYDALRLKWIVNWFLTNDENEEIAIEQAYVQMPLKTFI